MSEKKILVGTLRYLQMLLDEYGPDSLVINVIERELQK